MVECVLTCWSAPLEQASSPVLCTPRRIEASLTSPTPTWLSRCRRSYCSRPLGAAAAVAAGVGTAAGPNSHNLLENIAVALGGPAAVAGG